MLILIYVSICYVIFKIFKISVNQWSLATSAVGGIIGIALLLLIVNYNHPFTTNARIYFSAPVLHSVRGRVTEAPVQTNAPLKEGDALFHALGAAFQPNSLQRVKTGDKAESPSTQCPVTSSRARSASSSVRLRPARSRRRAPS